MSSINVLIANLDASPALELREVLENLDYNVVAVTHSSEETVETIQVTQPNIVLMNLRDRGKRTITKTGKLIKDDFDLPVVYIVDYTSEMTIRKAGGTHPYGYIFTPFDEKHILSTIETARIRHQFEKKLDENRKWLNAILTCIGDAVIACDEAGRIQFVNIVAEKLARISGAEAIGKKIEEVIKVLDESTLNPREIRELEEESEIQSYRDFEGLLRAYDGTIVPIRLHFNPIKDEEKNKRGVVYAFNDITSQRAALNEIKHQAGRAEALARVAEKLNSSLEIKDVLDMVCTVTNQVLNTSFTLVFLYDSRSSSYVEMARETVHELRHASDDRPRISFDREILMKYLPADKTIFTMPDLSTWGDPQYSQIMRELQIKSLAVAALTRNQDITGILVCGSIGKERNFSQDDLELLKGLAHQVTAAIANAKLFEQIKNSREQQRKLAKGLLEVQELERRHLARELHDDLGQVLTGLQFMLETSKRQAPPVQQKQIDEIQKSVGDVISKVREMSINLRPAMLDDAGLIPTLNWHFERYKKQTGISVRFRQERLTEHMPPDVEISTYRIIQEALTNTARHAQVEEVEVSLAVQDNVLEIIVSDQGRGFDPNLIFEARTTGLGGMRERAVLLGGNLAIQSIPNQGTKILAVIPISTRRVERRKYDREPSAR